MASCDRALHRDSVIDKYLCFKVPVRAASCTVADESATLLAIASFGFPSGKGSSSEKVNRHFRFCAEKDKIICGLPPFSERILCSFEWVTLKYIADTPHLPTVRKNKQVQQPDNFKSTKDQWNLLLAGRYICRPRLCLHDIGVIIGAEKNSSTFFEEMWILYKDSKPKHIVVHPISFIETRLRLIFKNKICFAACVNSLKAVLKSGTVEGVECRLMTGFCNMSKYQNPREGIGKPFRFYKSCMALRDHPKFDHPTGSSSPKIFRRWC